MTPRVADPQKTNLRLAWLACLACGALLALCLPKLGFCPLAWIVLAWPLSLWSHARSQREAALLGWLFGAGFWATGFFWIYQTCRFALIPWPAAIFAWLTMSATFSLCWVLFAFGALWAWRRAPSLAWPWICAALWAAEEFGCDRFLTYGGALPLGYTQWRYLSLIQPSAWFGPHALGFMIVLVNALLANTMRHKRSPFFAAGVFFLWWGAGLGALSGPKPVAELKRVAVIQPNVDEYRKWDEGFAQEIRSRIGGLVQKAAAERPDLVLWPESSIPGWLDDPQNSAWLVQLVRGSGTYQLIGTLAGAPGAPINAAALFDPKGENIGSYIKRQLVPFGEYVPMRPIARKFIGLLDQFGDLEAGAKIQPPLNSPLGRLGATICFEAVFPKWDRLDAQAGAQVLVNLTNDGWYKDTWGPYQHYYANRFRAIENRLPVVRAANTGISGVFDPYGRELIRLELGREDVGVTTIPIDAFPNASFYARHGDWFGWLCLIASLGFFISSFRRKLVATAKAGA